MTDALPLLTVSLAGDTLIYSNGAGGPFAYTPRVLTVDASVKALRRWCGLVQRVRLVAPAGWRVSPSDQRVVDVDQVLRWQVEPVAAPTSCLMNLMVEVDRADAPPARVVQAVMVEIWGRSQFRLDRDHVPFANTAHEMGEVAPSAAVYARTFHRWGALPKLLFDGLYSNVVFLTGDPLRVVQGGLCTGMARLALESSLAALPAPLAEQEADALRQMIMQWHGRQLSDQALLASTRAWVRQGSREAYAAFRQRVLANGRSDLAFDVNVPRPWRRDVLRAFVGSGHTVVPYALHQRSDDAAEVWVYDPNYPHEPEASRCMVRFDLARNGFAYDAMRSDRPGRPAKVIAVPQAAYRRARTGFIASVLSAVLYPHTWWPARWRAAGASMRAALSQRDGGRTTSTDSLASSP